MENSKIQWTHHTFNPWIGCTKVDRLCKFCYAEVYAERYNMASWGKNEKRNKTAPSTWDKPLSWQRKAVKNNTRYRVFCSSLADVFDDHESIKPEWRTELWNLIQKTPNLDWLLLTKRPENIIQLLPKDWGDGYKNVWLGVSAGDQKGFDARVAELCMVPANIKFVSMEPLMGNIFMSNKFQDHIDWVIVGGESGHKTKISKLDLNYVLSIKRQCEYYGIMFFFKQLGTVLASEYNKYDKFGDNFDNYPQLLDWLKVRQIPNYVDNSENEIIDGSGKQTYQTQIDI